MEETELVKRIDGKLEERLDDAWVVEYFEDPASGLYRVEVFRHNVSEWVSDNFNSLGEAQLAAHEFYDAQLT